MAGNTESQYGAAGTEGGSGAAAAGAGGGAYAPPIMHSWCLQPDGPREQVSSVANDADDDCGFDLNLGLSLGGAAPKSSSKAKTKEKEVVLDRDAFREKEKEATASEEPAAAAVAPQGGVMFKPLKSEQGGGGGNNSTRVQAFWQDLDRSGNEKQAVEVASSVNWAGVNSVAEDSKMFAQHMWQALQGKAAQAEHQRVPLSARDEASLIKELQGLPPQAVATAAAWARVVAQDGFPVQLLEAIRDGVESQGSLQRSKSVASEPALSAGGGGPSNNNNNDLERSDSDVSKNMQHAAIIQQQELVEQQRKRELQTQKRQEARRKRKALLEGQKSKKTSKKEESGSLDSNPNQLRRTSSLQPSKENSVTAASSPPDSQDASSMSAFRRPTGSSAWLHNWEGTKGGDSEMLPPQDSGDIRRTLERARAKDGDSNNAQVDSSSESRKVGSPDVGQLQRMDLDRTRSESGPPMAAQIDPSWIQRIMEVQRNSHQQQGTAATMENHGAKTNFPGRTEKQQPLPKSEKVAKRGRGASESSSGGTESSGGGGQDERSGRDGDALSSPASSAAAAVAENARPNSSAAMPAVAMANMTFPPGHPGGFPMMPGHPGGFPMMPGHPFPFPLPMPPGGGAPFSMPFPFPYVMQFAPGPVGDANNNNNNNPDQQQQQQRPFQIALPPGFNPQFQIQAPDGAPTWASAVVRPHAATPPHSPPRNGTGTKPDEKRGVKTSRNAPEPSSQSSLVKANSMSSGAFNRLRSASVASANGSPLAPQFGISRSKSDAVALRREGSVGSAFAALGELPFHPAPKSPAPAPAAPVAEDREQNASTPANTAASEETSIRRPPSQQQPTGVWRQGSVPSFEGIAGHEASSLRPGVAPGVQFGGTGSPPDLPWVTCNGTISGVLYRVEKGQVRIVCACHGRHMTPAEFVQHAGCGEIPNPEKAIVVGPFAVLPQQPASAQA